MQKVVKLSLILDTNEKEEFQKANKILWELQKQTRNIKNKTVQLWWEWENFCKDYYEKNGKYPKPSDMVETNCKRIDGYIEKVLKAQTDMNTGNHSSTVRSVMKLLKSKNNEIKKGTASIIYYKGNQPLILKKESISLTFENKKFYLTLSLLNRNSGKKHNTPLRFRFQVIVKDKSSRTILEHIMNTEYTISESKLIYHKKRWLLNLSYGFSASAAKGLDADKILGVDLGVALPICASVYGDLDRFTIQGGEIEKFRRAIEKRKKSLLQQGVVCGDGRIGHGTHTRNKPAYQIEDKIARFRDTCNHKYSRALIAYAIKKGCGTIQMEDLKGITKEANRFLKNWSYYDLQTKIKYKAEEAGIQVVLIDPKNTSRRCSKCGYIDKKNRKVQAKFHCLQCGFEENADYNASQNISQKGIDKIINKEYNREDAKPE